MITNINNEFVDMKGKLAISFRDTAFMQFTLTSHTTHYTEVEYSK